MFIMCDLSATGAVLLLTTSFRRRYQWVCAHARLLPTSEPAGTVARHSRACGRGCVASHWAPLAAARGTAVRRGFERWLAHSGRAPTPARSPAQLCAQPATVTPCLALPPATLHQG